jgi:hypothetical protein
MFCELGCDLVRGEDHLHAEWSVGYFKAYLFIGPFICHITTACTRHIVKKWSPLHVILHYPTILQQPAYSDAILRPLQAIVSFGPWRVTTATLTPFAI